MKKRAIIFLLTLCAVMLSGCSLIFEEPSALILPPASDQEEYVERSLINSFLAADAHLEVPEDMDEPAAFIDLDIDGDGTLEKLAFWSNNNHEVGTLLMKQNDDGSWGVLDQIRQYGNGIDYFKLIDFDHDGASEACIGFDVGGNNVLVIYQLDGNGFAELAQIDYSYLEIVDLNGDGNSTILSALNDYNDTSPQTTLTVYEVGETLTTAYTHSFDGNCLELAFGAVSTTERGLYFVRTSNYSDLNVELLLPAEDNSFEEQMTARVHYSNTAGSGTPIVMDVTGDGVLDVRSMVEPIEPSRQDEGDFLRIWKTWDSKSALISVYGVLQNDTDGYTFVLPEYCLDTVRYQFITDKGSNQVRLYDGDNAEPSIIFYAQSTSKTDNIDNIEGIIPLGTSPSSQRAYYALRNTERFAGQYIDAATIQQLFQIEGGQ